MVAHMRIVMALGISIGLGAAVVGGQNQILEQQELTLEVAEVELAEVQMVEDDLAFDAEDLIYDDQFFANASCPYLGEDFEGSLQGWSYQNVQHRVIDGALNLKSKSSTKLGYAEHDFDPEGYFTLDMEVTEKRNNNWLGFVPRHDGGPCLAMGPYLLNGLGAVTMDDGRTGLLGFDWNSLRWMVFNAREYSSVSKLGVGYYKNKLTLRINGKNKMKINADLRPLPDLDSLWLIVASRKTEARFDDICAKKRK